MHSHVTYPICDYRWLRFYKHLKLPQNVLTVLNFKGQANIDFSYKTCCYHVYRY